MRSVTALRWSISAPSTTTPTESQSRLPVRRGSTSPSLTLQNTVSAMDVHPENLEH